MKRSIFISVIFFTLLIKLNAQAAYKNFYWAMTIEQIRALCPDIEETYKYHQYSSEFDRFDFFVLGSYLKCIINDSLYSPFTPGVGGIEYLSRENRMVFHFEENKLRCIKLLNINDLYIADLVSRYGEPHKRISDDEVQNLFINENNRFILFVYSTKYRNNNRLYYLDRKWFEDYYNNFMVRLRNERVNEVNNLLD